MNIKNILTTIGIFSVVLLFPATTSASVIAQQEVKDIKLAQTGNPSQDFAPGVLNGELQSITLALAEVGSAQANEFQVLVTCFIDTTFDTPCDGAWYTYSDRKSIKGGEVSAHMFQFAPGYIFDPMKAYVFQISGTETSWGVQVFGSRDNVHDGDSARNVFAPYRGTADLAFTIRTTPPEPTQTDLTQSVAEGVLLPSPTITWSATVSDPNSSNLKLEAEIRPVTEPFNETQSDKIFSSDFVTSGTTGTLTNSTLPNGHYHVRTRTVTTDGRKGAWQEFGTEGNTDFIIGNEGLTKTFGNSRCFPSAISGGSFGMQNGTTKHGEVFSIPDIHTLNSITIGFASSTAGSLQAIGNPFDGVKITLRPYDNIDYVIGESLPIFASALEINDDPTHRVTFAFPHSILLTPNKQYVFLLERTGGLEDDNRFVNAIISTFVPSCEFVGDAQYVTHLSSDGFQTGEGSMGFSINYTTIAPDPATAYASNVLFLPGAMASRLYEPLACDEGVCEKRLWEPVNDVLALRLAHDAEGTSLHNDIYAKDVIDNAYLPVAGNVYKSFIEDMDALQTKGTIREWEAIPYDWRLTPDQILSSGKQIGGDKISYLLATSSPYIIQELKRLAANSKTGKVTIIAHSNGGLVTKRLTELLGATTASQLIDKIIFVAVPQLGTPKALGVILHGFDQGLPMNSASVTLAPETARTIAANMPGAYNLLPSAEYFTYVDDPVATFMSTSSPLLAQFASRYGTSTHSVERLRTFIIDMWRSGSSTPSDTTYPSVGNATLFDAAQTLHDNLDHWSPPEGVQFTTIAGWGEETFSSIEYRGIPHDICSGADEPVYHCWTEYEFSYNPKHVIDGDGTVVEPSALWANGGTSAMKYWVNLKNYNGDHRVVTLGGLVPFAHANILEVEQLRTLISNIITNKTNDPLEYISGVAPQYTGDKPRLHFTLHSPLTLGFKDTAGNYSGATATSTLSNIPGVTYERYGEVQWLSIPKELAGTLMLQGTGSGSFTLDAEEVNGNTILSTTSFEGIPSSTSTIVTMDIVSTQSVTASSTLVIDHNGDGTTDLTLEAKENSVVTLTTQKSPLTVIADNKSIILGSSLPTFTTTLSGFVNGDTAPSSVNGVASCTTTATATSTVGTYPITCTKGTLTSDKYDFTTFATGTLTIVYKWSGFNQPINDTVYNPGQSMSVFKGGSTIPVKFQLKNSNGTPVQSSTSPQWLTPQKLNALTATTTELLYTDPAHTGTTYAWDTTDKQYHYNWKTKEVTPGYWYRIFAKLDDGTVQSVIVGLR